MNVAPLPRREKDERIPRPGGGRRRPSPPYDDRKRREYRDRSPARDRLLEDRSSRPRDPPRFSRDDRFRDDRVREPLDNSRRRYEEPILDRRSFSSSKDDSFKYRRETESYREHFPDPPDSRSAYPNDCEVIVPNKQQRSYAEMVELRLKNLGLRVDLLFPHEETPLTHVLDDISRRGCPLAVVVLPQNEQHKSATVNILWGKPQEHRNMPLEDAVNLVARSYDAHTKAGREKITPPVRDLSLGPLPTVPVDSSLQVLLNLLAEGRPLSALEIDKIAKHLQERKEHLLKDADIPATSPTVGAGTMNKPLDQIPEKNPQDSQAELQKRILSILNQTPAPASSGGSAARPPGSAGNTAIIPSPTSPNWNDGQADNSQSSGGSGGVNFGNPNVQKALDNLIQSGPALLRTIQATGSSGGPSGNAVPAQMVNVARQQSGGQRPLLSPPGKGQMANSNVNNSFGVRGGQQQQQRHPLLGTLMPAPLMGRGNPSMGRF